jgi:ketosteroid isomerase-like protein
MERGQTQGGAVDPAGDPASVAPLGAEATARAFARALLARDPRAAATLMASDARLITPDGTEMIGRDLIRPILAQITTSVQPLEIRAGRTVVKGTVALCTQLWRRGGGPGALPYEASSTARLVLTRSARRWEIAIASPWE